MSLSLDKIERLAPDQSSLAAAKKLLKPASWPTLESDGQGLIWGECQGSGATPYRIAVTEADAGYKCTCPSRKFPCKHSLALMWMRADGLASFSPGVPPQWVQDWLGRRRGPSTPTKSSAEDNDPHAAPSIAAIADDAGSEADPAAEARAEAQRARNRAQRESLIENGIAATDRWIEDQLERGLAGFDQRAGGECMTLSKRLVDAKAGGLANRIAMLPSQLVALDEADRGRAVANAFATVHLIGQAYLRQDLLPETLREDLRQTIGWNLTREALLEHPNSCRADGLWRVLAVRDEVQPDRLRRVETWLERAEGEPRFAALIDFVPVAGGAGGNLYAPGELIEAELVFYPSPVPLRAQIASHRGTSRSEDSWSGSSRSLRDALAEWQAALAVKPWLGDWPLAATGVRLRSSRGCLFVVDEDMALPVAASISDAARPLLGVDDVAIFGTWDGLALVPMLARTSLGEWRAP